MGTTYLIAQTLFQLNLKHSLKGELIVWVHDYEIKVGYDCEKLVVWVNDVNKGVFLSNDLIPSELPEWIDLRRINRLMRPSS